MLKRDYRHLMMEGKALEEWDPEVSAPEVSAPEVSAPEVSAPEVSAPEVSAPEVLDLEESAFRDKSRLDNLC